MAKRVMPTATISPDAAASRHGPVFIIVEQFFKKLSISLNTPGAHKGCT